MPIAEATRREIEVSLKRHHAFTAKRLQDALNGQSVTLADIKLPQEDDPEEPLTERLRRFMRLLQAVRERLRTPEYGRCERCARELGERELVEVPWASLCRACAGSGA